MISTKDCELSESVSLARSHTIAAYCTLAMLKNDQIIRIRGRLQDSHDVFSKEVEVGMTFLD